jgi:hypothetical protein
MARTPWTLVPNAGKTASAAGLDLRGWARAVQCAAACGASALVLETHRPAERNKVQAFSDFLVFGMMAIGSFSSGQLLANSGWSAVN